MKLHIKYIVLLMTAILLGVDTIEAQERYNTNESEVVMRQSELDSLLLKIRRYKQAQRAKEREIRKALSSAKYDSILGVASTSNKTKAAAEIPAYTESKSDLNDERVYNEFARLNNRIDWMILNMNNGSTPYRSNSMGAGGNGQPNVIYIDSDNEPNRGQPFPPGMMGLQDDEVGANTAKNLVDDQALNAAEAEANKLQGQINEMNEKIRVLGKLGASSDSDAYDDEISQLNTRLADLKGELEASNKRAEEERAKRENLEMTRESLKSLREYDLQVYFANNSTSLGNSDKIALKDLAKMIKGNEKHVTIMLHGFASKSGSAQYNQQISFKRAHAVRHVLRGAGVPAKNIVILPHGIDDSGEAAKARRVEVGLSVN